MLDAVYAVAVCTAIHRVGKATVGLLEFAFHRVVDAFSRGRRP